MPSITDVPMSIGGHLDELRRRLMAPVVVLVVVFIGAFAMQATLLEWLVWPLRQAITLVPDAARSIGMPVDDPKVPLLQILELGEGASAAAWLAIYLSLGCALPVLLWQLWMFIAVGLTDQERRLAFLFVPAGVLCFYAGCVVGFFFAMPWFFAFLINFNALYQTTVMVTAFRLSGYIDFFFLWTIALGLVMDIPWGILCVVRTGLVRRATIARHRRYVVLVNIVLAAVITPGSDVASLLALFIPMHLLFELGLFLSRWFEPAPRLPIAS